MDKTSDQSNSRRVSAQHCCSQVLDTGHRIRVLRRAWPPPPPTAALLQCGQPQRPADQSVAMLGPFNSPLAKHLHAAAVASQRDGHRLSLGSRDRAGRTPPASISSIEVGAGARSPGEQLGVSSPTSPAAQRSRLATSSNATLRSPQAPASSGQGPAAPPPPPPDGAATALHELAISKQRAAVAAAAAAMQSPATGTRPGPLPRRPASAAHTPARAALSTPLALAGGRPATPASAAAAGTPASASGSAQLQPRTSFKQQAAQLLHQQQPQQPQTAGRRQSLAAPTSAAASGGRTGGTGSGQCPRPLLYQQQVAPPPTASLEEAMSQLQLQCGRAPATGPSGTPALSIRSRGELALGQPGLLLYMRLLLHMCGMPAAWLGGCRSVLRLPLPARPRARQTGHCLWVVAALHAACHPGCWLFVPPQSP